MPGGDKTGPLSRGPKTGRQLGYCEGNEEPGYFDWRPRRGQGRGLLRGYREKIRTRRHRRQQREL